MLFFAFSCFETMSVTVRHMMLSVVLVYIALSTAATTLSPVPRWQANAPISPHFIAFYFHKIRINCEKAIKMNKEQTFAFVNKITSKFLGSWDKSWIPLYLLK